MIGKHKIKSDFNDLRHMLDDASKYFDELKEVYNKNWNYYKSWYYLIHVYGVRTEKRLWSSYPLWHKIWNKEMETFTYHNGLEFLTKKPHVWVKKVTKKMMVHINLILKK